MSSVERTSHYRADNRGLVGRLYRFAERRPSVQGTEVKLAWPVYAWRVVIPRPFDRQTDPLERAVLRLAAAGKKHHGEIAKLLGLHPSLIQQTQLSCFEQGLLKPSLELSDSGQSLLTRSESADFASTVMEAGWIFRDAISGDVWPMFVRGSLRSAPSKAVTEAVALPHPDDFRSMPTGSSIAGAMRRYSRIARFVPEAADHAHILADRFDPDDLDDAEWDEVSGTGDENQVHNTVVSQFLRVVTLQPEEIYIECRLYINPDDPTTWSIASPFGLAGGWWFKRRLEWGMSRDPQIKEVVNGPLHATAEMLPSVDIEDGRSRVLRDFPELAGIEKLRPVFDLLVRAYAADLRYQSDPSDLDTVLTRYYVCLEALLSTCIETIHNREEYARLGEFDFRAKAKRIGHELGVAIPDRLCRDNLGRDLTWVARLRPKAMRDRAAFLLTHAYYELHSPFRHALTTEPGLLAQIELVTDQRNTRGAHYDAVVGLGDRQVYDDVRSAAHRVIHVLAHHFFQENPHGEAKQ